MKKLLKKISTFCYENSIVLEVHLLAGFSYEQNYRDMYQDLSHMDSEKLREVFKYAELQSGYKDIKNVSDLYAWIQDNDLHGFFIEMNFQIFDNYKFDAQGNFKSCSSTCMFHNDWAYAPDIETLFKIIQAKSVYYGDIDCETSKQKLKATN